MKKTHALQLLFAAIRNAPEHKLTASYSQLTSILCITTRSVIHMVKRLENEGVLIVHRNGNNPNTYELTSKYKLGETI